MHSTNVSLERQLHCSIRNIIASKFFKQARQARHHGLILISMAGATLMLSGCGDINQASPYLYWGKTPNDEQLLALKRLGIKSIVNVRFHSCPKIESKATELGMRFFHIRTGVFKAPDEKEIDAFLSIIRQPENRPVYVYCVGAKDRTTFYLGLHRMVAQGWTPEKAHKEMRLHGLRKWWPWFYKYDDQLRKFEPEIRQVAREAFPESLQTSTASGAECPCRVVVQAESKKGLLSRSR